MRRKPMRATIRWLTLAACIASAVSYGQEAAGQDTKESIKERMKERYAQLKLLKEQGSVGETHDGLVAAVKADAGQDVSAVVDAENADRAALYKLIARSTRTGEADVAANNALRIFGKAGDDELFRTKEGEWAKKKDLVAKEEEKEGE
jgi:uncharacterized protein YdbL (DUF1318 family)